ncbi:hypothetical protein KY331_03245 [Candidatus Woesearchaeota archaeon]|nr:hypothetical protein [Candidatus Woesearchaeota archaeon]
MEKEEIKKTERLFDLLKKKGTLRGFDDKKKVKTQPEFKSPEEIIAEHMKCKKEKKVPTVQELVEKKKKEI